MCGFFLAIAKGASLLPGDCNHWEILWEFWKKNSKFFLYINIWLKYILLNIYLVIYKIIVGILWEYSGQSLNQSLEDTKELDSNVLSSILFFFQNNADTL